jgi:hypothetical protein
MKVTDYPFSIGGSMKKKAVALTLLTLLALVSVSISAVQLQAQVADPFVPAGCTVGDLCNANADCGYPPCFCNTSAHQCRDGGSIEAFIEIVSQQ